MESCGCVDFHGTKVNSSKSAEEIIGSRTDATKWNLSVALNVIPVVGNIVAGIYHIALGLNADEGKDYFLIARGITECTIIGGFLLLIADCVVTLGRMCTKEPRTMPHYD